MGIDALMAKKIGIVGSRRRNAQKDFDKVKEAFLQVYEAGDQIVSGGCPQGADAFAERLAKMLQIPITIHYAQWNKLGKSAGFVRNGDIAREADLLLACIAEDRTGGTEDTITKFRNAHPEGVVVLL